MRISTGIHSFTPVSVPAGQVLLMALFPNFGVWFGIFTCLIVWFCCIASLKHKTLKLKPWGDAGS